MGIGFVLLFWAFLLSLAGLPVALGLAAWSWRNQKRAGTQRGLFRPVAAALLPFALLAYGGVAFTAYGIWCETVRHVDPGIGDLWKVPVGNDHFFCMIDVPDHGYLLQGGCTGAPPVSEITELVVIGDRIVGSSRSNGAFVFDTRSSTLHAFPDLATALNQFSPHPTLQTANSFHRQRRWVWPDLVALVLISIPAAAILVLWYRWFIRAPRSN